MSSYYDSMNIWNVWRTNRYLFQYKLFVFEYTYVSTVIFYDEQIDDALIFDNGKRQMVVIDIDHVSWDHSTDIRVLEEPWETESDNRG